MSNIITKPAPDFELLDQDGKPQKLNNYLGQWILLYFYPKDMTPGCTIEACAFRDHMSDFQNTGVQVLGISSDTVKMHKKFSEKYQLNFLLLSDESHKVLQNYGVWVEKTLFGKKYMGIDRDSFLIDKQGNIVKHYQKVNPAIHPKEVLGDIKTLTTN